MLNDSKGNSSATWNLIKDFVPPLKKSNQTYITLRMGTARQTDLISFSQVLEKQPTTLHNKLYMAATHPPQSD